MTDHIPMWGTVKVRTHSYLCRVRDWCRTTWYRLTHELGYAEALAALLFSATELFVRSEGARRVLTELIRAFLAVARSLLRERQHPDENN